MAFEVIDRFRNVFKLMESFLLRKPSDQQFHSPASFKIDGIPLCIHQLLLCWASAGKLCGRQEQSFVSRVCTKFEYMSPIDQYAATPHSRTESY